MARKSLPKGVNRIFVACVPLAICLSIIAISLQLRIFPGSTTSSKMSCCGPSCREAQKTEEHYDKDYFEWQVSHTYIPLYLKLSIIFNHNVNNLLFF